MRKQPKSWQAALLLASVMGLSANAAPVPTSVAAPQAAQRSAGTCTGVVVDENGEPLIGASVRVEGNKMGATADIDGRFTLTGVKPGSKIAISCVGCQPTTVVWNGSPLNVVLRNGDTVLDEVVVMGYGVQQKRAKITNSVSTVSDKALTTGMNANPAQALVGAASGVKVNITSGDPGATPSIVVRGGTDWNGNNAPLVVVDGQVRGSLSDINPNDIADMQILKDAGATALYGARAANGVILIKTKTGTAGNGKVQFSAKYGVTKYSAGYDYADAETFIKYMRLSGYMFANPANNETAGNYDPTKAYRWTDKNGDTHSFFPYAFPTAYSSITGNNTPYGHGRTQFDENMNWNIMEYINSDEQNELLGKGWKVMADPLNPYLNTNRQLMYRDTDIVGYNLADNTASQDYNLSFSGGNDKGNYYASLGYYSADGAVPESFYKRYNFAFTGGYNIMSWLRANSVFNYIRANWLNDAFVGAGTQMGAPGFLFARFAACPPTARISSEDGSPLFGYSGYNVKFQDPREVNNQTDKFQMNQSLTATLLPGLTLKGTMNWFYSESWYNGFYKDYIQNQQGALNTTRPTSVSFSRSFEQTYNAVANFVRTFQEKHSVNAMLGAEVLLRDYRDLAASGSKAPTDDFSNLQYAFTGKQSPYEPTTVSASNYYYKDALISYFGRAEYDYMDKYLIAGTLRADGYSRLLNTPKDDWNRWGVFPGVSAGWVFSKEDFWVNNPNLAFINYGKLRGSYGMNGIVNSGVIGYYTLQGSYSAFQYGGVTGFRISGLPNPGLKWERTRTLEGGVDLGFLNNRVNLGLTYYNRITMDKYADKTLAPTTGFSTVKANQGKYGNQGVEIDLQATAINTRDFRWNIGANITFNKNRVVELPYNGLDNNRIGGIEVYSGKKDADGNYEKIWVGGLQEGQEPNHMWGFRKDHMLRTWADVEAMGDYVDVSTDVGNKRLYATQKGLDRLKEMGMANGAIQLTPGDLVWKDVNGDNMIDNFDKWDLGNMTPHWTGGLNTQLSWKGLSLYARTDFSFGYTVYDGAYSWAMGCGQGAFGFMTDIEKTWTPDRPDAELPRFLAGSQLGSNNYLRTSDLLATTGSYLALRELQLSYAIPANICKKFRAQDLSLSITGQNLGYIKKTTLPLPDKVEYTSGNTGGWGGTYTLPVSVIFGLNVSF